MQRVQFVFYGQAVEAREGGQRDCGIMTEESITNSSGPGSTPMHDASRVPVSGGPSVLDLVKLLRPKQWAKSVFVLIGPVYGMALDKPGAVVSVIGAVGAFALASSGCYILNDLRDIDADRMHPRKRLRPIAAGRVKAGLARWIAVGLIVLALACLGLVFAGTGGEEGGRGGWLTAGCVLAYVLNVVLYTNVFKRRPVLDVMSLAAGFVLRVLGGCACVLVEPSSWLLNCTLFVAMFLAFGKRLGERRTMGGGAGAIAVRGVQASYSDETLRMLVVITAVASLLSYSDYVIGQAALYTHGFNLLWLTLVPATYALLRAVLLLERGVYDDPTELATRDRGFQLGVIVFGVVTGVLLVLRAKGVLPGVGGV